MDEKEVRKRILKKRNEKKISQQRVADLLGISRTAFRNLESGKTRIINENVLKFADITGTSATELLCGYDPTRELKIEHEKTRKEYEEKLEELNSISKRKIDALTLERDMLKDKVKAQEKTISLQDLVIGKLEKQLENC